MDPWLEAPGVFPDLHNRLITHLSEVLNSLLPAPYFTAIANRVWLEASERRIEPDANILKPRDMNGLAKHAEGNNSSATATLPEIGLLTVSAIRYADEPMEEAYLEIHASPGGEELVTAIEVLSITNKLPGSDGRAAYRHKQREVREANVNLVEIDLLRGGRHTTLVPEKGLREAAHRFDYHVCIYFAAQPEQFRIAAFGLTERLPRIAIPLLPNDQPLIVDLQPILNRCYEQGLYSRRVRYGQPCEPPLTPDQQAWAESILREKGLLK
jgi:hypothetical protein